MEQEILLRLEAAAKVICSSEVDPRRMTDAENVFMSYRRTERPYQICQYIFEHSSVDFVIFETCNTLKEALIREWSTLNPDDIYSIKSYLLQRLLDRTNTPVFIREKILQVVAIIVKRGSISDNGIERNRLLSQIQQLIMSGELRKQTLGCSIISSLMQEYAITTKSADVGLSWESHIAAKKHFETTDLKNIFQLCVSSLSEICKLGEFDDNAYPLLKGLLQIAESTLMWFFVTCSVAKKFISVYEMSFESDAVICLRLTPHWKDIILVPTLVQLFFELHWKIRNNAHLTHYSLNCLVQLASLHGTIFEKKENRIEYLNNYLQCFLSFLQNTDIVDREAIGVSNIFLKLLIFNEQIIMHELGNETMAPTLFQQMARLTCNFAENASHQDSMNYDESMFNEAYDNMLKAWNCLFRDNANTFKEASECIFDSYLRWHLSPPYGIRKKMLNEYVNEEEEEDIVKCSTQMQSIGIFGRQILGHTLPTLAKLIDEKTNELRTVFLAAQNMNNNVQPDELFEDLHWLLMIAAHLLTNDEDGNISLIPPSIMKYSVQKVSNLDVNDSLNLLATVDRPILQSDFSRLEQSVDHVIWLVSAVFRLAELEKQMGNAKLAHLLSPTLVSTVACFLQMWVKSYLFCPESNYSEVSYALVSAFGEHSPCAKWIVEFVLSKIRSNFTTLNPDQGIEENTCKLFEAMVNTKAKALFIIDNDSFWGIIKDGLCDQFGSPEIKKTLMKCFTLSLSPFDGTDLGKSKHYLDQVLKPIVDKFRNMVIEDNFKKRYHDEAMQNEIMNFLYLLQGVVEGTGMLDFTGVAIHKCLFGYFSHILPDLVTLISVYHNYQQITQLVLEFFKECSNTMLCYFIIEDAHIFYQACLKLVEVYVKHNFGRLTKEINAEEDSYDHILTFMDILMNLLNKDVIDLTTTDEEKANEVTAVDVCMLGFNGIMPMITVNILKFPTLCSKFYTLLSLMGELHSDRLFAQSKDFLVNILGVLELGLTLFGSNITTLCCEALTAMAKYMCLQVAQNGHFDVEKFLLLQPFLKILMGVIMSKQLNNDNIQSFGWTFYSLICCYKEHYLEMVRELISSQAQTQPELAERISKALNELTNGLQLTYDRNDRSNFENNFEKFVFNVQGFLFVK